MKKLDIFNHIFPKQYYELMLEIAPKQEDMGKRARGVPMLYDLDERFRVMDRFDDYQQILSLASPPLEVLGEPDVSERLAKAANDGMAELCQKHPERFPSFVASLPMNSPDGLLTEARRAVQELGACGVQVYSNANGKPLDSPEILPLFDVMAELDLPIWIHPARPASHADYPTESKSKYEIWWTFGWPLRDEREHGAHRVLGAVRQAPEPEDHHPPHGRHDPVLRRACRSRLGSARKPHLG